MVTIPATIADKLLGAVLDYLKKGGESFVKNIATKKEIKKAIERAAERFGSEYDNKELARALTIDTKFYDLPNVQKAIRELLEHPFDSAPQVRIEYEFAMVLPESQRRLSNQAAQMYFEILREELIGVTELNDKLKLIYLKRSAEATERTAVGVEKLVSTYEKAPNLEEAKRRYLKYIIDSNQYIDPRGIMQTRRSVVLKLDEVYVSLKIEREIDYRDFDRSLEIDYGNEELFDDDRTDASGVEIFDLAKIVRDNQRIVILGDPGAGKTTLLRFLSLCFSKSLENQKSDGEQVVKDKDGYEYGSLCFPIYFRIASYADAFSKDHTLSVREFILGQASQEINIPDKALRLVLESVLDNGQALILMDGLDEIVNETDRSDVGRRLEQFSIGHSNNRFVITSRIAGYRTSPLMGDFIHFTLRDMEIGQIQKFLQKWCYAVEYSQTPELTQSEIKKRAKEEADDILKSVKTNQGVRRLAANPLMLTILALIHRNGARLPSRRIDLYELATKTLLEDWELARGINKDNIVSESEALRLLGPLAYWLHEMKPKGIATEREVKDKLAEYLSTARGLQADGLDVEEAVNDFIRRVRQHTGLFVERAPRQYGFMHLTFEEYFCARELVRRRRDASVRIYEHRHKPRWEEPISLAIAFISSDYPEDAIDLIESSILAVSEDAKNQGFEQSLYEDVLHRDLLFAVRIVGDCIGLETQYRRKLLENLISVCFDIKGAGKYRPLRDLIMDALRSLRGGDMARDAAMLCLSYLDSQNDYIRGSVAWGLGQIGFINTDVLDGVKRLLNDKSPLVRIRTIDSVEQLGENDELIIILKFLLNDEVAKIRSRSIRVLSVFAPVNREARSGLVSAVENDKVSVASRAIEVLEKLSIASKDVMSVLVAQLRDEKNTLFSNSLKALLKLSRSSKNTEYLLEALSFNIDDDFVVMDLIDTLLDLGYCESDLVEKLLGLFELNYSYGYSRAVRLVDRLMQICGDDAVDVKEVFENNKNYVRAAAHAAAIKEGSEKTQLDELFILKPKYRQESDGTNPYLLDINAVEFSATEYDDVDLKLSDEKRIVSMPVDELVNELLDQDTAWAAGEIIEELSKVHWQHLNLEMPNVARKARKYLREFLDTYMASEIAVIYPDDYKGTELYNPAWEILWIATTPS